MSTKLYDGLKLKDPTADIFELTPLIAAAIRAAFGEAARSLVGGELIAYCDAPSSWPEDTSRGYPIFDVETAWKQQQNKLGSHHALNDPLRFSMVFGKSSAGNLLAYPYYREPIYREALEALGLFEDYHYQNQSDQPEEISEDDWAQRSAEWDSLIAPDGSFGDLPLWVLGRSMEPFSELFLGAASENFDANSYGTVDRRLTRILVAALIQKAVEELKPSKETLFRLASESSRTVRRFLETPAGDSVARPAPLPRGTSFGYSDIVPYEVSETVKEELLDALAKTLSG